VRISPKEQEAIRIIVELGNQFGFGNLMAHLQSAWTEKLMSQYGFDEATAQRATQNREGYPVKMHQDLMLDGYWDETGNRYK
jgi:hypothetical protein